ncbi:MAG: tetratricopeptide repeat protein [Sporocytophaga sp.]|uniref:DUF6340 family protein n=1 Tax=Sporocytophaga sp. TaxID=2231183 RepID=UPI001B103FA5|nr:DUF6340 family protein [Sporocytophaga sp.]MBO9700866.1 tetratricopeptide repeat protein [Sporocytophaga sp.]
MRTIYLLFALVLISSCSKKGIITMNVLEPAVVRVHPSIKRFGVINRTLPAQKTKPLDDLEKLLTLEGVNMDKEGADASFIAVQNELAGDRFNVIPIEKNDLKTLGAGVFPNSLPLQTVSQLCQTYQVDAILSLEFFDTDTKLAVNVTNTTIPTPLGNVPGIVHNATLNTLVKTGWRIYDPQGSLVIMDEFHLDRNFVSHSQGVNPMEAVKALVNRKEVVTRLGRESGTIYADRLLPFWTRVSRDYYIRGNNALKIATRKARAGNWDGAAEIWKTESSNPDPKVAGRAAYNYAIIHEINGDLDSAMKWAQKAYEDYNVKLALKYTRILRNRMARAQALEQ